MEPDFEPRDALPGSNLTFLVLHDPYLCMGNWLKYVGKSGGMEPVILFFTITQWSAGLEKPGGGRGGPVPPGRTNVDFWRGPRGPDA